MKKVKVKRIISTLIFAGLLFGVLSVLTGFLENKEARMKYTPFYQSETNFDVIFMGTSHVWNHILPMELWREYGISSYNWGFSDCTPAEDYYLLQDILTFTTPKVVVLDSFGVDEYEHYDNGKYTTNNVMRQHIQFDSLPMLSLNKYHASLDVFEDYDGKADFIWNFILYHNRWDKLEERDFHYEIYPEKGAYYLTGLGDASFERIPASEKHPVDTVCMEYYRKTVELCRERGIEVLCICAPYAATREQQLTANAIGDYVAEYPNCTYINMLQEDILNFNTDICPDDLHLNYSGARKVTSWLGQYLREHYALDDYSQNASWIQDYEDYFLQKKKAVWSQWELKDYLVQLADPEMQVQAEIYDPRVLESDRLKALLQNAGAEPVLKDEAGPKDEDADGQTVPEDVCLRLIIERAGTGEMIEDLFFSFEDPEAPDMMKIHEAG